MMRCLSFPRPFYLLLLGVFFWLFLAAAAAAAGCGSGRLAVVLLEGEGVEVDKGEGLGQVLVGLGRKTHVCDFKQGGDEECGGGLVDRFPTMYKNAIEAMYSDEAMNSKSMYVPYVP